MLLFRIDEKKGLILHKDAVKLESSLGKLPDEDLLYIILRYDYFSPYGQMNESQRALTCSRRCFKEDSFELHDKRLKKEIEIYQGLQYDIRRETIRNYQIKIVGLNMAIIATDSPIEIKKYHEATEFLTKAIKKMEHDLIEGETSSYFSDDKMSYLEKWAENKRKYKQDKELIDSIRDNR